MDHFFEIGRVVLESWDEVKLGVAREGEGEVVEDGGDIQGTVEHDGQPPPSQNPTRLRTCS